MSIQPANILLVDNYDSFTQNLSHLIAKVTGSLPTIVRNDDKLSPHDLLDFDAVVISPGPGRPDRDEDFGICLQLIQDGAIPLLGVCLGHQGIAIAYGGRLEYLDKPLHGRPSGILHSGTGLFEDIPNGFAAVRYHSLFVGRPLPAELVELASTADGTPMALRHATRPQWGVQFHPESVGSHYGEILIRNFLRLASISTGGNTSVTDTRPRKQATASPYYEVLVEKTEHWVDAEAVFAELYGHSPAAVWLDSSLVKEGFSRFSYMGAPDNTSDLSQVRYSVEEQSVVVSSTSAEESVSSNIFDYLRSQLLRRTVVPPNLPFPFVGGFVGYFGYGIKADCDSPNLHKSESPDSVLLFLKRLLVFDHLERSVYLVVLSRENKGDDLRWLQDTQIRLNGAKLHPKLETLQQPGIFLHHSKSEYLADIEQCHQAIRLGLSYQLCLTNEMHVQPRHDAFSAYRRLRLSNPAPYGVFFRCADTSIVCSSPERFLKVATDNTVEAKPMKGTSRRDSDPEVDCALKVELENSEKNRAENLMIVDVVRNDLSAVCYPGSISIDSLMQVETYATVHQMVSTVKGKLLDGNSAVDCFQSAFPPASMTGAPKRRSMTILEQIEGRARGIYSGAIGYFSVTGAAEFNVSIRAAVFSKGDAQIGVGGAITVLSSSEEEYEEMMLKAKALLSCI